MKKEKEKEVEHSRKLHRAILKVIRKAQKRRR